MKIFLKIVFIFFLIILTLGVSFYIFLPTIEEKARSILERKLSESLRRPLVIRDLKLLPGLNRIIINGIECPPFFSIDSTIIALSLAEVFRGYISLIVDIRGFEAKMERVESLSSRKELLESAPSKINKYPSFAIRISSLKLRDGNIEFIYKKIDPPLTLKISNIRLDAKNIIIPDYKGRITFYLMADTIWNKKIYRETIKIRGWLNLPKKDLKAKVEIKEIDGLYFAKIYPPFFRKLASRTREAVFDSYSELLARNDHLKIDTTLVLKRINFTEEMSEEDIALLKAVLLPFKEGEVYKLHFTINTSLTNFRPDFSIIRDVFKGKVGKVSFVSPEKIIRKTGRKISQTIKETGEKVSEGVKETIEKTAEILEDLLKIPERVIKSKENSASEEPQPLTDTH